MLYAMERPIVNPGSVFWTGQHWINYLREPGHETDSGMVSLWFTHYCAAGEGIVAFVDIPGAPGFQGICTDNPPVAAFMQDWYRGRGGMYDKDLPIKDAKLEREGDVLADPVWTIETATDRVVARWSGLAPCVILDAPVPKFSEDRDVYSLLFFAEEATITLNGAPVAGRPYLRDIWQPSIGGERSSCVFALSETFIQVQADS